MINLVRLINEQQFQEAIQQISMIQSILDDKIVNKKDHFYTWLHNWIDTIINQLSRQLQHIILSLPTQSKLWGELEQKKLMGMYRINTMCKFRGIGISDISSSGVLCVLCVLCVCIVSMYRL